MELDKDRDFFEINIAAFIRLILGHKSKIVLLTITGSICSIFYSLSLDEIYVSDSIHVQAEPTSISDGGKDGMTSVLGVLGGGSSNAGEISKTILHLKSRTFFQNFYQNDEFLAQLMAFQSFDKANQKIIIDSNTYDVDSGQWVSGKPLFEKSFEAFHGEHFNVFSDMITGFITVRVKYYSPEIAVDWNDMIVDSINLYTKDKYIKKSLAAIEYYKQELALSDLTIIQNALIRGIEKEMSTIALSEITDEFSLEIIDKAFIPVQASEPQKTIIVIIGTAIFFLFGIFLVIIYELFIFSRNKNLIDS